MSEVRQANARSPLVVSVLCAACLLAPAVQAAGPQRAVSAPAVRAEGFLVRPDGRVAAMVELADPPVAEVYAARMQAATLSLGGRESAVAAAQVQLARLERAQEALVGMLTAPEIGATVIYRAQRAYNGVAVEVDAARLEQLRALPGVKAVHPLVPKRPINSTSVPFIGAPQVWNPSGLAVTGTGIKVGVIDTGIDYLHKDFGGSGQYRSDNTYVDPNWPRNAKVVGGYDFAGDSYDASGASGSTTPTPDPDPQDCNGHGTHVAGTLAGYGETMDNQTFAGPYGPSTPFSALKIGPGVAPGAQLYSLRVFGCNGSSNLVIPALEWAMDPNKDGSFADHLDVVNMSLGSDYGTADDPDVVASNNAALAGVVVVAAAGNAGDGYFITGSPATADRAISAASSGDPGATAYNVHVNSPSAISGDADAVPAAFGPQLSDAGITSDLVLATPNDGCTAFTNASAVKGKIALVIRGGSKPDGTSCTFVSKVSNAQTAGATAVVVTNNRDGNALVTMADDASGTVITIPSGFISQNDGDVIRGQLPSPGVNVTFSKESLADAISDFSSRGPRAGDLALKPDIADPGSSIVSAQAESGTEASVKSGTSMATPHIAGTMALLKQLRPTWTVAELKALVMNTGNHTVFSNPNMMPPPVGPERVGAGRVDAAAAGAAPAIAFNAANPGLVSVSLGALEVTGVTTYSADIQVVNKSATPLSYALAYNEVVGIPGVTVSFPQGASVSVPAGGSVAFPVQLTADASQMRNTHDASFATTASGNPRQWLSEEAGYVTLTPDSGPVLRVPLYAAMRAVSAMGTRESGLPLSGSQATFDLHLVGQGISTGTSYPTDVVSLVSALELQEISSDPSAQVRYLGVTSDYAAQKAKGKGIADTTIFIGLAAASDWSTPLDGPVDIVFNVTPGGFDDYELTVDEVTTGDDAFIAKLCRVGTTTCQALGINGPGSNERDTAVYDTNVVVLPVKAAGLGLSSSSGTFRYSLKQASGRKWHTFDPSHPGLTFSGTDYLGTPAVQPLYNDLDGQTITVSYSQADYQTDAAKGVLLLHHHNAKGSRAQVLGPRVLIPRKNLHH
jgi:subtilisin family serine protease